MKKILKIVLIIVLFLIALFCIAVLRKVIVIKNIQKTAANYLNSTNYHIESIAKEDSGTKVTINYYHKNNKETMFMERDYKNEITTIRVYNNDGKIDTFYDTKEEKIANLNTASPMVIGLYDYFECENLFQTITACIPARIEKAKYNGKTCYVVDNFMSQTMLHGVDADKVYIDKETGLCIKTNLNGIITDRKYEFDNVDDSVFIEPDIKQYKVEEVDNRSN